MDRIVVGVPGREAVVIYAADEPNIFRAVVAIAAAMESENLDAGDEHLRDAAMFLRVAAKARS